VQQLGRGHLLTHGHACWLLDGLDEVISRDPGFFEYILDICTRDNAAAPRILICVRDSLLSASQGLRDFVTQADELITEFRLLPWEIESLRSFAKIRLVDKAPKFVATIEGRPNVLELCRTPYYAELLAQRVEDNASLQPLAEDYEEMDLLDDAVRSIIEREYDKGLLQRSVIGPTTCSSWSATWPSWSWRARRGACRSRRSATWRPSSCRPTWTTPTGPAPSRSCRTSPFSGPPPSRAR